MNKPPLPASSDRDYWNAQLIGWGCLAIVGVLSSLNGDWRDVSHTAAAKLVVSVAGLILSHVWRNYLHHRGWITGGQALPIARIGGCLMILSAVQTAVLVAIDQVIRNGVLLDERAAIIPNLAILVVLWFVVFLVWTLAYTVAVSRRSALRSDFEKMELEVNVKNAELRALQAQVNPHFFFNSMNSIRALIYADADAAARAVSQLTTMMRYNLQAGDSSTVRLADELAAVNAYLGMEKLRFEEQLQLSLDIEEGLDELAIPPMVLQTLVENAVKHGVESDGGPCHIRLSAARDADTVCITVANQGSVSTTSTSTRIGLNNAAKRLTLLFGTRASCTLSEENGWVVARIVLPQVIV